MEHVKEDLKRIHVSLAGMTMVAIEKSSETEGVTVRDQEVVREYLDEEVAKGELRDEEVEAGIENEKVIIEQLTHGNLGLENEKVIKQPTHGNLGTENVKVIEQPTHGNLWIGNEKVIEQLAHGNLGTENVKVIEQPTHGNLWIGNEVIEQLAHGNLGTENVKVIEQLTHGNLQKPTVTVSRLLLNEGQGFHLNFITSFSITLGRRQSKTLSTNDKPGSKIYGNSVFDCHLSSVW